MGATVTVREQAAQRAHRVDEQDRSDEADGL
jgi:hypothetical protein